MNTKISIKDSGAIRIEGEFEIFDSEGIKLDLGGRTVISLCRCGQSATQPFCNGAHKSCAFSAPITTRVLPPKAS